MGTFNNFPGNNNAVGSGTTLWEPLQQNKAFKVASSNYSQSSILNLAPIIDHIYNDIIQILDMQDFKIFFIPFFPS